MIGVLLVGGFMPRGGKREGAGRKPVLARQEQRLAVPAKKLKQAIIPALDLLSDSYLRHFRQMVAKADGGDTNAIRWLLEYPLRFINLEDTPETPIGKLRETWTRTQTITVEGAPSATEPEVADTRPVIDAEYRTLP